MYRVFLGAPSKSDIPNEASAYSWRTLTSTSVSVSPSPSAPTSVSPPAPDQEKKDNNSRRPGSVVHQTQSSASLVFPFPLETLEEARRRVSLIYRDVVFGPGRDEEDEEDEECVLELLAQSLDQENEGAQVKDEGDRKEGESRSLQEQEKTTSEGVEVSVFRGVEQTTVLTWPPTALDESNSSLFISRANGTAPLGRNTTAGPSFILNISGRETQTQFLETQAFSQSFQESRSISDGVDASIARFPSFHFNPHTLTSLASLSSSSGNPNAKPGLGLAAKTQRKVNLLVAVLEVEGPDTIRLKKGVDAGKEVSVLKLILGDEEGAVGKLTAWREVAEEWGGMSWRVGVKRGDVVHLENVMATCDPASSTTFSASPYLKSSFTICYRTMPYTHEDGTLRPDLRLSNSEPSVRKVATVVRWFENMAGLAH